MSAPALIDCRNITVSRGDTRALDNFSLTIPLGENTAIIGPNGCGKSTLIKTIARELHPLYDPDSSLTILGKRNYNIFELRPLLGIVSDDLVRRSLRPAPGRDVILSGFFSTLELWPHTELTSEMERKADEVIELLEIRHLAERCTSEMSSGEIRRVIMGRALVHDPKALMLDEPTNSLDIRAVHEWRRIVRKIAQSGVGIILVTHHLSDIIPEIERVVLLRNGRIYRDGPKRELLTAETLESLFQVPVELVERDGFYHLFG
jgi:iron complex transport system ATP-binding protein